MQYNRKFVLFKACIAAVFAAVTQASDYLALGSPESNILTKDKRYDFVFTAYPSPAAGWGKASNVADERQRISNAAFPLYGVQAKADAEGIAYLHVNLRKPYLVRAFAVTGFSGGSHKPKGPFFLEGSNDGSNWMLVGKGEARQWHAPGTYPFLPSQIVKALYPRRYQHYRVIAKGWSNGYMVIYNLGLFS